MKIEYTTPATDTMAVEVCSHSAESDKVVASSAASAVCTYTPAPFKGIRDIPVGKFKAIGDSGRVEEATVVFDLRKGEFVIRSKHIVADGFAFDKPHAPETIPEVTPAAKAVTTPVAPPVAPPAATPVVTHAQPVPKQPK